MKPGSIVLLSILATARVFAADFDPFEGPKPIAVLIQTDPWRMVIGSDTPRVAIYEDGRVIFLKVEKDAATYQTKTLKPKELDEVKHKLSSFGPFDDIKSQYEITEASDQPESKIFIELDGRKLATAVYGLRVPEPDVPKLSHDEKKQLKELPKSLRKLHEYLGSLSWSDAQPWQPKFVEAMIWDYDYAPDESIHWPKDWPGLDSPQARRRGDSWSIFLPGDELPRLREFLATRKERGAVEIDGKKWAAAYRRTFPREPVWFKAFNAAASEQPADESDEAEHKKK